MITIETVKATMKLYNKMFEGVLPQKRRITTFEASLTENCLKLYGRKSVVYVFRAVMANPVINDRFGFVDYEYIFHRSNYSRYLNMYFKNKNNVVKREQILPVVKYMRHIAHANRIIFKEVLDNIQNQNNHEQR